MAQQVCETDTLLNAACAKAGITEQQARRLNIAVVSDEWLTRSLRAGKACTACLSGRLVVWPISSHKCSVFFFTKEESAPMPPQALDTLPFTLLKGLADTTSSGLSSDDDAPAQGL
jgi:hypothetical protein